MSTLGQASDKHPTYNEQRLEKALARLERRPVTSSRVLRRRRFLSALAICAAAPVGCWAFWNWSLVAATFDNEPPFSLLVTLLAAGATIAILTMESKFLYGAEPLGIGDLKAIEKACDLEPRLAQVISAWLGQIPHLRVEEREQLSDVLELVKQIERERVAIRELAAWNERMAGVPLARRTTEGVDSKAALDGNTA